MTPDNGILQSLAAGHGPLHFALLVHEVKIGKRGKAVIRRHLLMQSGACAGTAVGSIALDNCAADGLHQRANQLGAEVVAGGRFAGGNLDGEPSGGRPVQRVIHTLQALGRNVGGKVHRGHALLG